MQQPHVHLHTFGQAKAHFVFAPRQHVFEFTVAQNVVFNLFEFLGPGFRSVRQQQIEVANGFFPPPQRTRRRNGLDRLAVALNIGDEFFHLVFGSGEQKTAGGLFENFNGLEDVLLGFFAEAGQVAQLAPPGKLLELRDRAAVEFAPEDQGLFRTERLQREQFEHRDRIFLQQLFAQPVIAGGENFADVFGHAFADAGELFELFRLTRHGLDGFGKAGDQFGGFLIAAIAADDGAVDLQQLCGLAQNARDLPILHTSLP